MMFPLARSPGPMGAGRGAAAAFSPASLAGLDRWLEADAVALADGDPVTTWPDASPSGKDATGSGASRPTFRTAQLNGLPVVTFGGAHQLVFAVSGSVTIPFTAFVVGCSSRATGTGPPQEFVVDKDLILAAQVDPGVSGDWGVYDGSAWSPSSYPLFASTYRVCGYTRSTTANYTLTTGAVDEPHTTGGTPLALTEAIVGSDQFGQFLVGAIAAVLIYSRALSGGERGQVVAYLAAKYGL